MSGHDVRVLQDFLTRAGFATPVVGTFGPMTERNVKRFERTYRLTADGIVDAAFVRQLRSVVGAKASADNTGGSGGAAPGADGPSDGSNGSTTNSSGHHYRGDSVHMGDRVLRPGMGGHDVRVLQDYLTLAGYQTTIDGAFGPTTKRNLIAFQKANNLTPDGVVTYNVNVVLRNVVAGLSSQTPTTTPGSKAQLTADGLAVAPADAPQVVQEVIAAANRIAFKPYVYGGGHGSWNDNGYDCSGSVSYALHGGGLLSSPEDSTQLESYGSSGAGQWITIWANAGHTYMVVAGLRFDTSGADARGGSRWSSTMRSGADYVVRHPTGY